MNKKEIGQLLTMAALVDNRTVTPEACLMWHDIIGYLSYDAAVAAMKEHYAETSEWIMPAHIANRVRAKNRAALPQTMSEEAPPSCPEGHHKRLSDGTCLHCTDRGEP